MLTDEAHASRQAQVDLKLALAAFKVRLCSYYTTVCSALKPLQHVLSSVSNSFLYATVRIT